MEKCGLRDRKQGKGDETRNVIQKKEGNILANTIRRQKRRE